MLFSFINKINPFSPARRIFQTKYFFTLIRFYCVRFIVIVSPLEQFEINNNFNLCTCDHKTFFDTTLSYSRFLDLISFNTMNETLFYYSMGITSLFGFFISKLHLYPYSRTQIILEYYIIQIRHFVCANASLANQPMLVTFVCFITSLLIFNVSGMIPFSFTITAHFIVTFFYSFSLFFGINFIALKRHRLDFFTIFLPSGTPFGLLPLLVGLEFISYFSRLFSLSIRLFANLMAGHALMNIFTSFVFKACSLNGLSLLFSSFGIVLLFIIIFMEFAISFLQVFVFTTLAALYLTDVHDVDHSLSSP